MTITQTYLLSYTRETIAYNYVTNLFDINVIPSIETIFNDLFLF